MYEGKASWRWHLKEVKSKPTSAIPESRHGICQGYETGMCLAGLRRPAWRNRAWKAVRRSMWDHWGSGGPDCIELFKNLCFSLWMRWVKISLEVLTRGMTWTDSYGCYAKNKQTSRKWRVWAGRPGRKYCNNPGKPSK